MGRKESILSKTRRPVGEFLSIGKLEVRKEKRVTSETAKKKTTTNFHEGKKHRTGREGKRF